MEPMGASPQPDGHYFHTDGDPENFVPPTDILTLDNIGNASDAGDIDDNLGEPVAKVDDEDDSVEVCLSCILIILFNVLQFHVMQDKAS